jgi:endoglucanase
MDLLERLVSTFSVSGNEDAVRKLIKSEIEKYVDEIYIDRLGNLIAHKKGKTDHPKIMLAAHMDEIGLMVKKIGPSGKLYFSMIGGIDSSMLLGERVHIETKKKILHGVITTGDVNDGYVLKKMPDVSEMFVDTGLSKNALKRHGVDIGTYLSLERDLYFLGSNKIICGKAFDDRLGCYILIKLAQKLKNIKSNVYYVFTIQEEVGLIGAPISAYKIQPDWGIVVDCVEANDASERTKIIGEGPCITIKDEESIGNRVINNWLMDLAKKKRIPIQKDVSDEGTTDAVSIATTREGIPSTVVGVPIRNLHTTVSVASLNDVYDAIKLLTALLKNPPKTKVWV